MAQDFVSVFRVLKLGGRLAISDIVYTGKIEPQVRERFQLTRAVSCLEATCWALQSSDR